ncbi:hypothetical protein PORY_000216 [Pneumocystis oryctolagi]|uniref:Uncharacterized protein n=1 Tax=Pneumocystis oryctolagi TaxID=42067 RepID=A0ACB7CGJ5_9ASCO|nr:hypothetical protein PORY_000216 [Pneumocystis oryctolagi]
MTNRKACISKNADIPVIFIEDSPKNENHHLIFSKKNRLEKWDNHDKEDECFILETDSQISLKKAKLNQDEHSIIDISSSPLINLMNEQDDEIDDFSSVSTIEEKCSEQRNHLPHTISILSAVDEFSLNIIKSAQVTGAKNNPDGQDMLDNSKNNCELKDNAMINQKMLEKVSLNLSLFSLLKKQTRKKIEKKRSLSLKNVNKHKSKKECIKEMIVNIDKNILSSPLGPILSDLFKKEECEFNVWSSPVPNLISWKRKVVAEYDEKLGYFVPIPETIRTEKHILVYMKASELLKIKSDSCMDELVKQLTKEFPDSKIIYMIESIDALLRKIKNSRNRRYISAIRANIETNNSEPISIQSDEIDDEQIENMMLRLQLVHNAFIVNTSSIENSAEWIYILTSDISTIPYKKIKLQLSTSFCMESGQIKTGVDPKDTYNKLLQTIHKVTPQIADVIIQKYPKISHLVSSFHENGPDALSDITIGNLTKRKIGPVLSKRIFHAFMTSDSTASAI